MKPYIFFTWLFMIQVGFIFAQPAAYEPFDAPQTKTYSNRPVASFGFGIGVPYGIMGLNVEAFPIPRLSISAGLGTTIFDGLGYSIGVRYYSSDLDQTWQSKVGINYGVNSMVLTGNGSSPMLFEGQKYHGFSVELGEVILFGSAKRHGIDIGLNIIATSKIFKESPRYGLQNLDRIKYVLGYRFFF